MADANPGEYSSLVILARRGDRRAFADLYARFSRAVHGVILARASYGDAADLVQDVFATALERLPQLADPAAFPGWILAIARNRATDHLRAKKPIAGDDELENLTTSDSGVRRSPEITRVLAALRSLPEAYQETMILRFVEQMSGPEIAEQTGLSPGSVRVNLHRGMKLLREKLGLADNGATGGLEKETTPMPDEEKTADDYLWDKSGDAPPDVKRLEDLLAPLAHDPAKVPLDELRMRRPKNRRAAWIAGGAVVALAAGVVIFLVTRRDEACSGGDGMSFIGTGGDVSCAGTAVASGVLPVGATLDTGANGAKLKIAAIGIAELGANTRVRLDRTSATGHNIHLEQGSMHARVSAPPRLFAITTPSTAVTDLGCEYVIEVDAKGVGSIRVISGKVELQANSAGTIVVAPAGTHASILPGNRPGIPLATSASEALVDAVESYERGRPGGLAAVLAAATESDAITLVNIAILEPGNLEVLQRLGAVSPSGSWNVDTVAKDRSALEKLREEVVSAQIVIDGMLDR